MHKRTKELLEQLDRAHDWAKGQTYSSGGTRYFRTDTCCICGLERSYFSDEQNDIKPRYTFINCKGEEVALRDAIEDPCLKEGEA